MLVKLAAAAVGEALALAGVDLFRRPALVLPAVDAPGQLACGPALLVEVRGDDAGTLMKLIDTLEEDDDVQTVWGNYNVPDEELEKLA